MTELISIGPATTLTQNVVYALPARQITMMATAAISVSVDGSAYTSIAATTTGTTVTAVFAKCTSGNAVVVCRA